MSATLGPILATGAITITNQTLFNNRPMDWRIPIATGLASIGFNLAEKVAPTAAELLAWTVLVTSLFTRVNPNEPSAAENALRWWNQGGK
jgi:hypothetical protein